MNSEFCKNIKYKKEIKLVQLAMPFLNDFNLGENFVCEL